jgi:hypothetical protein
MHADTREKTPFKLCIAALVGAYRAALPRGDLQLDAVRLLMYVLLAISSLPGNPR